MYGKVKKISKVTTELSRILAPQLRCISAGNTAPYYILIFIEWFTICEIGFGISSIIINKEGLYNIWLSLFEIKTNVFARLCCK